MKTVEKGIENQYCGNNTNVFIKDFSKFTAISTIKVLCVLCNKYMVKESFTICLGTSSRRVLQGDLPYYSLRTIYTAVDYLLDYGVLLPTDIIDVYRLNTDVVILLDKPIS